MATDDLTAALHACATGLYPLEAGVALLISNGTFLDREDFTCRFIETGRAYHSRCVKELRRVIKRWRGNLPLRGETR